MNDQHAANISGSLAHLVNEMRNLVARPDRIAQALERQAAAGKK